MKLYTQGQVNRIFKHIPTSTLLHWCKMDVINWSGECHDGRGIHRLYNKDDLDMLGLVEELTVFNFPLDFIRKYVTKFHFRQPKDGGKEDLIDMGGVKFQNTNTLRTHQDEHLVLYFGWSARNEKVWGSSLEKKPSLTWQEDLEDMPTIPPEDVSPIITNVVIRLLEVIKKVDGYISEEE